MNKEEIVIDLIMGIRLKGSITEMEKVVKGSVKIQKIFGPKTLMIETVPPPQSPANILGLRYMGSISGLSNLVTELLDLKKTLQIDTIPLPYRLMIGTWPTPDKPKLQANINVNVINRLQTRINKIKTDTLAKIVHHERNYFPKFNFLYKFRLNQII